VKCGEGQGNDHGCTRGNGNIRGVVEEQWLEWILAKKAVLSDADEATSIHAFVCMAMMLIVYRTTSYQYQQTEIDAKRQPFDSTENSRILELDGLPKGVVQATSDLELKPLWSHSRKKADDSSRRNLLAIAAGIKQKQNVDSIVQKVVCKTLFTSRCFSTYDFIFLWDEDLGVRHFHPGRYLDIVKSERFEISQPALDSNSTEIHHRITIRKKTKKYHRRIYDFRGFTKCTSSSMGPPCTGWVEGMAPVFSRSAWRCAWHLIQNDLVHGWGLDMKLGYCAQGDRTKRVGIIDRNMLFIKAYKL
ncbi:polyprotein, partial [Bienertia sinuspersici]